jgi:hypothetical protein
MHKEVSMYRLLPILVAAVLLSLAACGLAPGSGSVIPSDTSLLSSRTPNPRLIGAADAPVKIIEFSDYQ